ncbi:MAG: large conductance mechanosensitive channel protein MscL [Saprospiraceae bacterium]|nr:large conductance mechanosensitive channel protein MscL [Saprospiraceae bacterium]
MLKEFKEFALKGNMMDLAIGFILGAAFGTVVTSLTNDILMPVVSGIFGSPDFSNLFMVLKEPADLTDVNMASADAIRDAGGAVLAYGKFINAIISFLLVAFALFFVVKGLNKMKKKEEAPPPAPAGPTAEELLAEIRDELKKK